MIQNPRIYINHNDQGRCEGILVVDRDFLNEDDETLFAQNFQSCCDHEIKIIPKTLVMSGFVSQEIKELCFKELNKIEQLTREIQLAEELFNRVGIEGISIAFQHRDKDANQM